MLVDSSVVHQNDNLLGLRFTVNPKFVQSPVQEIVEHYVVSAALCDLGRYHAIECHSRNHREGVSRLLLATFGPLQQSHLDWQTRVRNLSLFQS
jgi:hypothetical protein